MASTILSFRKIFRLIFILFSLYLMGDAFYRWDGFRYYASFPEFLPGLALTIILWSVVAVFMSLLVWLSARLLEWFCPYVGWKIRAEHFLLFLFALALLGVTIWIGRHRIWDIVHTQRKILFLSLILISILITWLFRNKVEQWMRIVQERITPLVWLFGILVLLSVPLVTYHTWVKQAVKAVSPPTPQHTASDRKRLNIILVTFDTLSAQNMSLYGYYRPTTPFITEWANKASVFTRLEAASNWTPPAAASLMTGKRPWTHRVYHMNSRIVKGKTENLPLALKNNGYYNMAFIVNPLASVKTLGIADSFEVAPLYSEFGSPASLFGWVEKSLSQLFAGKILMYDWIIKGDFILRRVIDMISRNFSKTIVPPERAFNRFLLNFNDNLPEPFFIWIHVFPPHHPYLPVEPFMGMFDSSPELRTLKSQWKLPLNLSYKDEMQPTVDILRDRYDEFIRYCDKQFEDFITRLTTGDNLKNTLIILSSDHGETFERNFLGHTGPHLYEPLTNIPLIIREPGQNKGIVIDELAEQIDIPPTILELADIPAPSWMEGHSLVPLMRGKRLPSHPVFSMTFGGNPSRGERISKGTIAVWEGDYKLIYYLKEKKSLLFNLKEDPDELNNLINKEPEAAKRLLPLIQENLKEANEKISRGK